ncbi:hypothetical protein KDK88_00340 [bacterium]|nr:hypothetical protein [bacterium]
MNPLLPTPDALPIPGPAPLFTGLLHLTFVVHLIAMNFLLGGGVLLIVALIRRKATGDVHDRTLARLSKLLPTLFSATVTTGVAPLLFMQVLYGNFFYTSSIVMAWPWFSLVLVLIAAYYLMYLNSFRGPALGGARGAVIWTAVLLTAFVGFLFSNNTSLMLTPETWGPLYFAAPGGTSLNTGEPMLWPRYAHMVLGAVAVAGLGLALLGRRERGDAELGRHLVRHGLTVFGVMTAVNALGGVGYLMGLKRDVMLLFMGDSPHATGLMGAGIALTLALILLAFRARSRDGAGLGLLSGLTALTLAVMVLMRHVVRDAYLGAAYQPQSFAVQTQTLNIAIFAALLVGGLITVVWMVRKLLQAS